MTPFSLNQACDLLRKAQAAGASGGDIFVLQGESFEASVRLKAIEKISEARSKNLTLRLFFGQRHAITSTSDFTSKSLNALLTDTCRLAKISPEDAYAGLPASDSCAKEIPALDIFDSEIAATSTDEKIALARRAEEAAFEADSRIQNSEGATLSHAHTTVLYAATNGFSGSYPRSASSLSMVPIAIKEG